tara:strand:- start:895 stop:1392 length:498 start_codon:yes stop_codon:yes gene_type:complete
MTSKTGHSIKKRDKGNDIFITPEELATKHIKMIEFKDDDIWYDPFKNSGNYYNNYPNDNKQWSEILEQKDFFEFDEQVDIICSNPPYSMINQVLEKSVSLKPRVISYLIGMGNLTTRRIEYMNENGYGLFKIRMLKVHSWYGMSFIVHFELGKDNCIEIDRKIYH